jgi:hypothetical protein
MSFAFNKTNSKSFTKLIDVEVMNLKLVEKILSEQNIRFETDNDVIQVTKGLDFDVFISIEDDKSLIKFRTYVKLNPNITAIKLKNIVAQLNEETGPLKFTDIYYKDKKPPHGYIDADYYFFYHLGVTPESFLYLLRFFSLAFADGIKSVNKDNEITDVIV